MKIVSVPAIPYDLPTIRPHKLAIPADALFGGRARDRIPVVCVGSGPPDCCLPFGILCQSHGVLSPE
jgi:hypothetical protein